MYFNEFLCNKSLYIYIHIYIYTYIPSDTVSKMECLENWKLRTVFKKKKRGLLISSALVSIRALSPSVTEKKHLVSGLLEPATDIIKQNLSTVSQIFPTAVPEYLCVNLSELRLSTCSPSFLCIVLQIVTCKIYRCHSLISCMIWKGESCSANASHFYWCQYPPTSSSYCQWSITIRSSWSSKCLTCSYEYNFVPENNDGLKM